MIRTTRNISAGETFSSRSRLKNPTILQLRQAGAEYPAWVTEHYLQIPGNFSPRIASLASGLVRDQVTPYDKAAAITDYLRHEIEYAELMPAPPPNTDLLEWFLFDVKKGFCNYYATAEVLMLRSVGVPARLAVGYSQGIPNEKGTVYYVLQNNAHAWVEVYFPGIGWVEFEPTVSQSPLVRPEGVPGNDLSGQDLTPLTPGQPSENIPAGGHEAGDEEGAVARPVDYLRISVWVIIILLAAVAGILLLAHFLPPSTCLPDTICHPGFSRTEASARSAFPDQLGALVRTDSHRPFICSRQPESALAGKTPTNRRHTCRACHRAQRVAA